MTRLGGELIAETKFARDDRIDHIQQVEQGVARRIAALERRAGLCRPTRFRLSLSLTFALSFRGRRGTLFAFLILPAATVGRRNAAETTTIRTANCATDMPDAAGNA